MTPTPKELRDLTSEIMQEYPLAKIGFDPLPSGVRFLDVVLGRRRFVLEFHPTHGTGVCEITDDTTPFDAGYDHLFDSVGKALNISNRSWRTRRKQRSIICHGFMCRRKIQRNDFN